MEMRTDRVGLLLDQHESSVGISRDRLAGLTDEEYFWEPVPDCWSVRRRGETRSPDAFGPGDWLLDWDRGRPQPEPFTTIAWRLGHLISMYVDRWEWTFGSRSIDPEVATDFTPSADKALAALWEHADRFAASVAEMTDEQLDIPGYGQFPYGLDPQLPFVSIVWWMNRELIHHTAEVALLRDLYLRRGQLGR
jgi:DinB superfamily